MLKGRRSSTPGQNKEKEKSKDKPNQKQQRSASTSAIKNNNNNNNNNSLNSNSSVSLSYSLPNNGESYDQANVDNYANNNAETADSAGQQQQQQHWSDFVCETVLLVLSEGGGLHFEVVGGADEGKFPYVGPVLSSADESGVTIQSLSPSGIWQFDKQKSTFNPVCKNPGWIMISPCNAEKG